MPSFRQFWPVYLLYWPLAALWVVLLFSFVAILSSIDSIDAGALAGDLEILSVDLLLAAPVVLGFWSRRHIVRGLWIAFAWFYVVFYLPIGAANGIDDAWMINAGTFISHALIVTGVLQFTTAGRTFFSNGLPIEKETEKPALSRTNVRSAADVMRLREERRGAGTPSSGATYQNRLAMIVFVGGAMAVCGFSLGLKIFSGFGSLVFLVASVVYGKTTGNKKLFFRRR